MWSVLLAADPLLVRLGGKTTRRCSPNYTHVSITPMFIISEPAAVTLATAQRIFPPGPTEEEEEEDETSSSLSAAGFLSPCLAHTLEVEKHFQQISCDMTNTELARRLFTLAASFRYMYNMQQHD